MMFLVRRREELSAKEFRDYWRDVHAGIAAKMPGLRKYTLHQFKSWPDSEPHSYDGIAELWWDDEASMREAFKSPESKAAYQDARKIIDMGKQLDFTLEQVEVV